MLLSPSFLSIATSCASFRDKADQVIVLLVLCNSIVETAVHKVQTICMMLAGMGAGMLLRTTFLPESSGIHLFASATAMCLFAGLWVYWRMTYHRSPIALA